VAAGCVPIYWGCPSIAHFFDPEGAGASCSRAQQRRSCPHNCTSLGIIMVSDELELLAAVEKLSVSDYTRRSRAIAVNAARARL
jgi:hypothetical protein